MRVETATSDDIYRVYQSGERDGYPVEWHATIKHAVREASGNRCLRCGHPYTKGMGEWSLCDPHCTHDGPIRWHPFDEAVETWRYQTLNGIPSGDGIMDRGPSGEWIERYAVEAQWRVLTVHHLNGIKLDCRWFNLVALCQRCHLTIQGKVKLEREFVREHSEWFKPYAAGWYAWKYEHRYITRAEAEERMDELLDYELTERSLW